MRFTPGCGRIPVVEASYLQDLDAEGLQPGEKPVQVRLIPERPVHDGLDRLH
jgi:hypothetical protein